MKSAQDVEYAKEFQKYFQEPIISVEKLEHKGNNQLFVVSLENKKYLIKKYSSLHLDNWKRGKAEFKALTYLWENGFREIPQAVYFDEKENIGIYSFERGRILKPEEIDREKIEKAVEFLVKVHNLDKSKENFSPASSACLSLMDYVKVIDSRISKIINYKPENNIGDKARAFLDKKVLPIIEEIKKDFFEQTKNENINLEEEIPLNKQVLTPADFGFHNILFEKENYKFLDFEYFGRDDAARQILDFIHHDKTIGIDKELKKYFVSTYIEKRNLSDDFKERLKLLDKLIGVTWVLIYLNVLSEKQIEHIKFAHGDIGNIIEERLTKAEKKIENISLLD